MKRKMERILIIDDDVELCTLIGEYLQAEGFTVESVHDGESGLQRATAGGYLLVVLDVMLPGINGFEVLRRIRATFTAAGAFTDSARRRCGPHRRAGDWGRRLSAEAFQSARTGGADSSRPAPHARGQGGAGRA